MAAIFLSSAIALAIADFLLGGRTISASWVWSRYCCPPGEGLLIAILWRSSYGFGLAIADEPARLRILLGAGHLVLCVVPVRPRVPTTSLKVQA